MGQLEKYGLYVLCLVIFLILGVTIWGDPDSSTRQQQSEVVPMRVNAGGMPLGDGNDILVTRRSPPAASNSANTLQSLLQPASRPRSKPKVQPKVQPKVEPKSGGNSPMVQPAVKLAVKPAVVASPRKYTVKNGDMLGHIAQKQLGSTRYVNAIRDLNPALRNSDKLSIGQVLVLPASGKARAKVAAGPSDFRTYTISKGDTFERIAKVELNSPSRCREIQDLNPNVHPHRLIPGKRIKLPLK